MRDATFTSMRHHGLISNTSFFGPYVLLLCRCAERRLTTFLTIALPRDRMLYPIFWNAESSIHKSVKQRDDLRVMLRVRTLRAFGEP